MSKKQKYAEVLDDSEAIQCIREWLLEHRNGFKSPTSAYKLAKQLGYPELNRELVILRGIRFDDDASLSECVKNGLKKNGVRKKLLPQLAARVFGRDPSEVFNRLISFSDLERTLRGVSAPVEAMAKCFSCEKSSVESQTEALFGAMDALFVALGAMDRERYFILLRIVCVLHLTFRWSAQVDADCEITEQVSRRFFDYLDIPDSERSLIRLKAGAGSVVSRILPDEEPVSVLVPEYEEWCRLLFLKIDMQGTELLEELIPELRQLPGNPFRLTYGCGDVNEPEGAREQDDDSEQNGGDPTIKNADEDRDLEGLDTSRAGEKDEIVDLIDRATDEAESLRKVPQREQLKLVRKYFDELAECVSPLEYNHYKDLPVSELRTFLSLAVVAESRISGVRSTLENEISRRESAGSDDGEAV